MLESRKYLQSVAGNDAGYDPERLETGSNITLWKSIYGLAGHWKFDEGSGINTADLSRNGNTGTWSGTLGSQWTNGKVGQYAGQFNGTDNYVVTNFTPNLNGGFSFNFWINSNNLSSDRSIVGTTDGDANQIRVRSSVSLDVAFGGYIDGTNSYRSVPINLSLNQWAMISVIFNATSSVTVYQNGSLLGSKTLASPTMLWPASLAIGQRYGSHTELWSGSIDDVRVYNRALSAAEIQALYNATR
jgi:hypothetical protein